MRDTLCALCNRLVSMHQATVLPLSFLPCVSLIVISTVLFLCLSFPISSFSFSIFCSLSVAYSKCCPTIVKWAIFGSSVLGLDEAAVAAATGFFQGRTFLNEKCKPFHTKDVTYRIIFRKVAENRDYKIYNCYNQHISSAQTV